MKLEEIWISDKIRTQGGYPTKNVKDKSNPISRRLRRKADKNNPRRGDTKNPEARVDFGPGEQGGPV